MVERNDDFWVDDENELREFKKKWMEKRKEKIKKRKDYSMDDEFENRVEESIGLLAL